METEETEKPKKGNQGSYGNVTALVLGIVGLLVLALPLGTCGLVFYCNTPKEARNGVGIAGLVLCLVDVCFGIFNILVLNRLV